MNFINRIPPPRVFPADYASTTQSTSITCYSAAGYTRLSYRPLEKNHCESTNERRRRANLITHDTGIETSNPYIANHKLHLQGNVKIV